MAKVFVTIVLITSILILISMIESSKVGLGGHYEHHYTKNDFAGRRHRPRPWHSSSGSPSSGTSSSGTSSSSSAASSAGSSAGSSGSSAGSSAGSSGGGSSGGGSGWGHRPHRPYRPWGHRHHSWNQGDGYVHRIYYGW